MQNPQDPSYGTGFSCVYEERYQTLLVNLNIILFIEAFCHFSVAFPSLQPEIF